MKPSWRWFGPYDPMPLAQVGQAGAEMLETSLPDLETGVAWTRDVIRERKALVEAHPSSLGGVLRWEALGGIRIHDDIKLGRGDRDARVAAFKETVRNLAREGVRRILINVMPLIDWVRTDLDYPLPTGARTTVFDLLDIVAFDIHVLRKGMPSLGYDRDTAAAAAERFAGMDDRRLTELESTITGGLPGGDSVNARAEFDALLLEYQTLGSKRYFENMASFIGEVCDVLEEEDALLAIHPDDPPWPICGLPKMASSLRDYERIFDAVPSRANGMLLCTGALGASPENDVVEIARRLSGRVNYAHLRSIEHFARHGDAGWSFMEADHLGGATDLYAVASILVAEEHRRVARGESELRCSIPFRADHAPRILDDLNKQHANPGYTAIGMTKATAELRGMLHAIERGLRAGKAVAA